MDSITGERVASEPVQQRESQTAADFIDQQMTLEQDAREVLPYVCASHGMLLSSLTSSRNLTNALRTLELCGKKSMLA